MEIQALRAEVKYLHASLEGSHNTPAASNVSESKVKAYFKSVGTLLDHDEQDLKKQVQLQLYIIP